MAKPTPASDKILMGYRMVQQLYEAFLLTDAFMKEHLKRTCDDEKLRLGPTRNKMPEEEIFLLRG